MMLKTTQLSGFNVSQSSIVGPQRYWRLLATDTSWDTTGSGYIWQAVEIEFYESTDGTGTDLNLAGTASASSESSGGTPASYAADGTANFWSSEDSGTPEWWQIDLGIGSEKTIHSVSVDWRTFAHYYPEQMKLQYSSNASDWTDKATINVPYSFSSTFQDL